MSPDHQHSTTSNHSSWKRSAWAHKVTCLGAISDATTYRPSLPPYRVGDGLHSIGSVQDGFWGNLSMFVLAILFTHGTRGGGTTQALKAKGVAYG